MSKRVKKLEEKRHEWNLAKALWGGQTLNVDDCDARRKKASEMTPKKGKSVTPNPKGKSKKKQYEDDDDYKENVMRVDAADIHTGRRRSSRLSK